MNAIQLESQFAAMGARLKVRDVPSRWRHGDRTWIAPQDYAVDIQRDGNGQFFELRLPTHLRDALDVSVMQNEPKQRHLLLLVRTTAGQEKLDRFLCGHDEREWFVAAVPGGASSVRQAMDRLQPADVQSRLASERVPFKQRYTRKNVAFRFTDSRIPALAGAVRVPRDCRTPLCPHVRRCVDACTPLKECGMPCWLCV